MGLRSLGVVVLLLLLPAGCGSDGDESSSPTPTEATETAADDAASQEDPPATTSPSTGEPEDDPDDGDGVGSATLTIGDETWAFDQVNFCAVAPPEDETESFVMISIQGDLQLVAKTLDPTGERRLEGDGVWDTIDFTNTVDPTMGAWSASSEVAGEQFLVVDGLAVTAAANFDDLRTTEIDDFPGTLEATCP